MIDVRTASHVPLLTNPKINITIRVFNFAFDYFQIFFRYHIGANRLIKHHFRMRILIFAKTNINKRHIYRHTLI